MAPTIHLRAGERECGVEISNGRPLVLPGDNTYATSTTGPGCLMFIRQLHLTTALRPSLYDDEALLFVQDSVGLYEGKFKIPSYQNGHAYLTSHRVCYVDNEDPRKYCVAIDLKEIDRTEFYAGFLKSSAKVTLFPKQSKRPLQPGKNATPRYASPSDALVGAPSPSPAPSRDVNATWICSICGLSNAVPPNFDPSTANQHTPMPPCQACGIKPGLVQMVKASIAAMSNRPAAPAAPLPQPSADSTTSANKGVASGRRQSAAPNLCPRCTFQNHPSLNTCEICGAQLQPSKPGKSSSEPHRPESPGPSLSGSIIGNDAIETIKLSFRAGGEKIFLERLKEALVQRKWLLQSAPPVPRATQPPTPINGGPSSLSSPSTNTYQYPDQPSTPTNPRVVGIAGLERRGAAQRENNQAVIGTAFEDLSALMTSAKEVIAMAESFAKSPANADALSTNTSLTDSLSTLNLITTKDMLGSTTSASETLYLNELARNLAEFLTDDRRGVLKHEGGIMSLVDLWAVFNRTRGGIELVSPRDFEKAATQWETLGLPVRLRRFRSGLLVVQDRGRSDERTVGALVGFVREDPQGGQSSAEEAGGWGRGVTAQETAERFGWSVGVAAEELEMGEEMGRLCRDQCLDGTRFWENHFLGTFASTGAFEQQV